MKKNTLLDQSKRTYYPNHFLKIDKFYTVVKRILEMKFWTVVLRRWRSFENITEGKIVATFTDLVKSFVYIYTHKKN